MFDQRISQFMDHRMWRDSPRRLWGHPQLDNGLRTLIVGAGSAARMLIRDLRRCPEYGLRPVGCVDDDVHVGSVFGLPVLGALCDLGAVVTEHRIDAVVIAIPSLPTARLSAIAREAVATGAHVRFLPSFLSAVERVARGTDMRTLRLSTLLGREERYVVPPAARSALTGARVLVTGAGGSIGEELCRQVRRYQPASLHMLDHDESNLHTLELRLDGQALLDSDEAIIADVRDATRIRQVFADVRPDIVFHAAAHKHLPLLERYPCEGVKSNVLGTHNVVQAALEVGAERMVLISTDKAADPSSVLGATKRLAEMIVQANAVHRTQVCSVRFGNVLGSRGSFLAVLADQLEQGAPVTVTHPDVTRFFMTVEEAVGLVLTAASMAEYGETFVLDMGDPVRIVDLVHEYARQLHLPDVEIHYTGLRPGEKLHEALFSASEDQLPTAHPAIWGTRPAPLPDDFAYRLDDLYRAAASDDGPDVRRLIKDLLPDYTPAPAEPQELALACGPVYADDF